MTITMDVLCHIYCDTQKNGHACKCRVKSSWHKKLSPSQAMVALSIKKEEKIIRQTKVIDVISEYLLIELTVCWRNKCTKNLIISLRKFMHNTKGFKYILKLFCSCKKCNKQCLLEYFRVVYSDWVRIYLMSRLKDWLWLSVTAPWDNIMEDNSTEMPNCILLHSYINI